MTDERPRQRVNAEDRAREVAARKRVAGLVSGGLHFKVKREGNQVQAARGSTPAKLIARLTSKTFSPEVTLDVRGKPAANIREAIASLVSAHHRRGVQQMSIIFDAQAAEGDAEIPLETILAALTIGAASALVRAFASARTSTGVEPALALLLI